MKECKYKEIKRLAKGTNTKVDLVRILYHSAMRRELDEFRVRLINSEVIETFDYETALKNIR